MEALKGDDPRTVGPYVLIARLGSGGMGQVFLGRTRGGRTVAVKVVRAELAGDREFRRRFRQEVAAARLVSGRYTAPVVDADPEAATPWLATAYVSGLTLRVVVGGGALLPERSLRVLAYGLARALAEIHSAGVVHRDLKPSNVILAVDGPHVIDFGISRVMASTDLTRTDVGTIVGSPGFMSPEQTHGQALTPATDVFSLGTVLAYAATGRNPFGDGPDHALLYRIAHDEPNLSGVPDSLAPLITTCLAKDPSQRPSTAQIIGQTAEHRPQGAWLPADLTAAIAQSAAEILDYEGIAVFPQPDVDPMPLPGPAPARTLVLPTSADRPTALLEPSAAGGTNGGTGDRTQERIGIGQPPEGRRGTGGAGLVAGLLSVAVIAALATALVLVLRTGNRNPGIPPTASVGTSTSQSPLTRSVSPTTTTPQPTPPTTPTPTTTTTPLPTTPASTTKPTTTPSTPTSTTRSTTPSTSQPTTPSTSTSSSTPPSSSPPTTHSSPPPQPTTPSSDHS